MSQVYVLERMTYEEVAAVDRSDTCVILPMGPLEAHGPHLPLGVDMNAAAVVSAMAAELLAERGINAAILPVMPYTLADVAMPFEGNISLSRETIISFVVDVARSISSHGFKKMVVFCHHGERPNLAALHDAAGRVRRLFATDVLISNALLDTMGKTAGLLKGEHPEWDFHAGEMETAFYLWKFPHLVKTDIAAALSPNWSNIREKFAEGAKDFMEAGGTKCYFGDPARATAAQGEQIYRIMAETLADETESFCR